MKKEIKEVVLLEKIQFMAIFSEFSKLNLEKAMEILKQIEFPEEEGRYSEKYFVGDNKLILQAIYNGGLKYESLNEDSRKDFKALAQIFEDVLSAFD